MEIHSFSVYIMLGSFLLHCFLWGGAVIELNSRGIFTDSTVGIIFFEKNVQRDIM